ncbi:PilZ domain-containing protein [Hyphomicrobium sp.]|nr:PilZ domain-containing protein [Hyphomicrobium sp.]
MDRRQPRMRVQRPGTIAFGGSGTMPCAIRDVSTGGARLEVASPSWVINAFDLRDVMTGIARKAVVVWREDCKMGVRFVDEGDWPKVGQRRPAPSFGRRNHT